MVERIGSPVPFVKICGTSNICKPPISEVIITYTKIGRSRGSVILKNTCVEVAPSTSAASKSDVSIPIIPAISKMVVFPNHIRKFIKATSDLALHVLDRNLNGSLVIPAYIKIELTGPLLENKVKNSIANADAIIRLGK